MRKAFVVLLAVHALLHVPGLAGALGWGRALPGALAGPWQAGHASALALGGAWFFAALCLGAAALAAARRWPAWSALALSAFTPSLLLCLLYLPECGVGAAVDLGALFLIVFGLHRGWRWLDPPAFAV